MSAGYRFVPLPDQVKRRDRSEVTRLDRRVPGTLAGQLEVTLTCLQDIHVGSGFKALVDGKVVRTQVRSGELLVVPGSTVSGLVRARFEAITHSCALGWTPWRNGKAKTQSRTHQHIKEAQFAPAATEHPAFKKCEAGASCPGCGLFGLLSQRGRVSFLDLKAGADVKVSFRELEQQFGPRAHHLGPAQVKGDQFRVESLHGRKFAMEPPPPETGGKKLSVEVIPAQTQLTGQIRLYNVAPAELGGLLAALGCLPKSKVKVGAAKAQHLGLAEFKVTQARLRDYQNQAVDWSEPTQKSWQVAFLSSEDCFKEGLATLSTIHASLRGGPRARP